jgi:hypothetical protein
MIQNFMSMRNGGMMPPLAAHGMASGMVPVAPAAFDPYANPQAMRAHAQAMNAQAAPTPPASPAGTGPSAPPNPAAQAPPANELAALVQMYGGLVLAQLNMGAPGYAFADYVVGLSPFFDQIRATAQGGRDPSPAPGEGSRHRLRTERAVRRCVHPGPADERPSISPAEKMPPAAAPPDPDVQVSPASPPRSACTTN